MAFQTTYPNLEDTDKRYDDYSGAYSDSSPSETNLDVFAGYYHTNHHDAYNNMGYQIHGVPMSHSWSWTEHPTIMSPQYPGYWTKDLPPAANTMLSTEDDGKSSEPERRPKNQSKKFKCDWPSCSSAFARKADRDRHKYCVHQKDQSEKKDCPESNCLRKGDQGFTRTDHLTEHLRNFHHKELPRRPRGRPNSTMDAAA